MSEQALTTALWKLGQAGFIASLLLCGCSPASSGPPLLASPPIQVRLVSAKRGVATRSIVLPGEIAPLQQATLYAKVGGYVKSVTVDKGDVVEAGKLLADIEVPELLADRAKYRAELEVATIDYRRISEAQGKAPDLVIPQAVDAAKGKQEIARANLERVETLLGYARITAPFGGVITRRLVDPGAFVPAATSGSAAQTSGLFTLMDFSVVRVQVAVPESEVPLIKNGLKTRIGVEELHREPFEGTVTRSSQSLDEATKTMLAEIELPNPNGELRPGMFAQVRIVVQEKPGALLVPAEAVVMEKTRSSIFIIEGNKARRFTVKTGFIDAGWVEILDGWEGDKLIAAGKQGLTDGQPVTVMEQK